MKTNGDREAVMEEVDKCRAKSVYVHSPEDCSEACKARGTVRDTCKHNLYVLGSLVYLPSI